MYIRIFASQDETEFAVCNDGDQVMRAVTASGELYPRRVGEYEVTGDGDLSAIEDSIRARLGLHLEYRDNCPIDDDAICHYCGRAVEKTDPHYELALFAGKEMLGSLAVYHAECEDLWGND
jgi:hypothetical protein